MKEQKKTDFKSEVKSVLRKPLAELRMNYISLSDQIAESDVFEKNWKFKEADRIFSDIGSHPDLKIVTKYYPLAKGGPLLVDEPKSEKQMVWAYEKQKHLKKLGYRHIVIEKDTNLSDCLVQLGEI